MNERNENGEILCSYGCGQVAIKFFKNGKGCCSESRNMCPALKEKNAKGNTGRVHSEETKRKISESNIGRDQAKATPFLNSDNVLCSYGCGQLAEYVYENGNYCCCNDWHACPTKKRENGDRKIEEFKVEERKERHRSSVLKSWQEEDRIKQHYSFVNKPETKKATSERTRKMWAENEQYREKMSDVLLNKGPNKSEQYLIEFFKENNIDFKFVGDGQVWIDGRNPDFINEDSKKIIELFGNFWHGEENTNQTNKEHEDERVSHFKNNGYECLVIWEDELNNSDDLNKKINEFLI